ncbi:transposase [Microbacterium sp. NPDC091662]|uniref:transposase n=1 Tax=Microbacterium sp. NPDC091662 TaxID=3364211 RepID=UPI00381DE865
MVGTTFEEIAAGLYSGPPEAFVSSRKARAAEADAHLASRILALRKPSIAAWVVNVFAQERAGQLGEALELARELREAQDDLDAAALAKLGRERRALTRKLAQAAGELAASRGERVTSSTLDAVEQSISAAFYDPAAAAAVASGRLSRALDPSATQNDIRDAVAGDVPELDPVSLPPADELQARRARREAERAIAAAEKDQASAERELTTRDKALRELRAKRGELAERTSELENELARIREELRRAEHDLPEAERSREDAATRAEAAADALDLARKAKDAL